MLINKTDRNDDCCGFLNYRGTRSGADSEMADVVDSVLAPGMDNQGQGWIYRVMCPALFGQKQRIFGANPVQALRLARPFVLDLLDRHGITLATGGRGQ